MPREHPLRVRPARQHRSRPQATVARYSRLSTSHEQAFQVARGAASLSDGCIPTSATGEVLTCVDEAREKASRLFHRIRGEPHNRFLSGFMLSREEFYLASAQDLIMIETPADDAYEVFRMFHYEDDARRCYININESPRVEGRLRIRIGVPPEELSWDRLRPEQRDYFERHLPEVAGRFRREV